MEASATIRIERVTADDGPAVLQVLSRSGLPTGEVVDHLNTAIGRDS